MQSQLGLFNLWTQGDFVTRAVALLLLLMSLASWMVILGKALSLRLRARQARAAENFWTTADFAEALNRIGGDDDNPFHRLARIGWQAKSHLQSRQSAPHCSDVPGLSDWVTRSLRKGLDETTAQLQSGLAVLASVGSTAPFVGLFGTVWGIYHALLSIGSSGQATIDKVAGPIGEALIMTALGLAVAIPAVLGYNALVRGNKGVVARLNHFAYELHALFVTGARIGASDVPLGGNVLPLKRG